MVDQVGESQVVTSLQTVSVLKFDTGIKCSIRWSAGLVVRVSEVNQSQLLLSANQLRLKREAEDLIIISYIEDSKCKRSDDYQGDEVHRHFNCIPGEVNYTSNSKDLADNKQVEEFDIGIEVYHCRIM